MVELIKLKINLKIDFKLKEEYKDCIHELINQKLQGR